MTIINKDILTVEKGIIAHQVNARGVMGAGLALAIKNKWPQVEDSYLEYLDTAADDEGLDYPKDIMGDVIIVPITSDLAIANLIAQETYGRDKNKVYTNYNSLEFAIKQLNFTSKSLKCDVYLPYKIGCGLANGDWDIVSQIIEQSLPNAIICKNIK